jgi:isopentenyl diphosphate isomerase/L-lactate dehydrogenase-like FMN-dependent dehydrogenase
MPTGVGAFAGAGTGKNRRNAKVNAQIAAVTPDQTRAEMRAQFFSRSRPAPVKIPKMAKLTKNAMTAPERLRTAVGKGGALCGVGTTRITSATRDAPSSETTLYTIETIPAAVTDAVGFLRVFTTLVYHPDAPSR